MSNLKCLDIMRGLDKVFNDKEVESVAIEYFKLTNGWSLKGWNCLPPRAKKVRLANMKEALKSLVPLAGEVK